MNAVRTAENERSAAPPPAPKAGKKEATRARIIERAIPLFSEFGYDKITMESIAKAAGISRANIYLHFSAKAELVAAMLEQLSPTVVASYAELDRLDPSDVVGVRRWVETNSRLWIERRHQLETLEHALAVEPVVSDRWYRTLSDSADAMTRFLDRHSDGSHRRGAAKMAVLTMMMGFERTLYFTYVRNCGADESDTIDALAAQWTAVLTGATLAQPSHSVGVLFSAR